MFISRSPSLNITVVRGKKCFLALCCYAFTSVFCYSEAACNFAQRQNFSSVAWRQVGNALYLCRVCFFFFFRQSCTIFLGRWLMSVLVVTNFKPLVYIHTVHASFSVVLILYSCYNTLPRTTSFMFQLPAPRHSMLQKILSCLREKNV